MPDEQPRSKSYKISGTRSTGMIVKRLASNPQTLPLDFKSEIPELGAPHPYSPNDLYFYDADWQPRDGKWGDLVLNYSWKRNGVFENELRSSVIESPLNTRSDYLLKWDHNLLTTGTDTAVPAFWATVTSLEEFASANTGGEYSVKTNVNATTDKIVMARTKIRNTYKKPTVSVLETVYFDTQGKADNLSLSVGLLVEPSNLFSRPVGDGNRWLVTSAPVTREGGYWVVKRTYQYNDEQLTLETGVKQIGWDFELYDLKLED